MAHAQGVDTDGLQFTDTTAPYLGRNGGSQDAGIIVYADALHLHSLAVECKAAVG